MQRCESCAVEIQSKTCFSSSTFKRRKQKYAWSKPRISFGFTKRIRYKRQNNKQALIIRSQWRQEKHLIKKVCSQNLFAGQRSRHQQLHNRPPVTKLRSLGMQIQSSFVATEGLRIYQAKQRKYIYLIHAGKVEKWPSRNFLLSKYTKISIAT